MRFFSFFCAMFIANIVQAEMVDTFQFRSDMERQRGIQLARSLRCLQCQNQNLVESNATQAYKLRLEVYEMVNEGKSDDEIIRIMTDRFGDFVYYKPVFNPQTWVLWGTPFALLFVMCGAIIWRVNRNKNNEL